MTTTLGSAAGRPTSTPPGTVVKTHEASVTYGRSEAPVHALIGATGRLRAGDTVAALAAHIDEAEIALRSRYSGARAESVPKVSSHRSFGRSSGMKKPCARPRSRLCRIFAIPCRAASLG